MSYCIRCKKDTGFPSGLGFTGAMSTLCADCDIDSRESLRQHWIREHLPPLASMLTDFQTWPEAANAALKCIDACLDAVCGPDKKGEG